MILAPLVVYAGFQLRDGWLGWPSREAAALHHHLPPTVPPPFTPMAPPHAVLPSRYVGIAQKTLFDRSRNSDIIVDEVSPPPPLLVPPVPVYHGMMDIGDGAIAILCESGSTRQQAVRLNEEIGPFKLVALGASEITLQWQGGLIYDMLDEISADPAAHPDSAPIERTEAARPPVAAQSDIGSAADAGGGIKACEPGDTSPQGTVVRGFRKVVNRIPYGETCFWAPLSR